MDMPTMTTERPSPELAVAYLRAANNPRWISQQRDLCKQAANQLGVQLVAEYFDIGGATRAGRPGLEGLLARLQEAPGVRYVLVTGVDRLARGTRRFLDISETLIEHRVSLVDARDLTVIEPPSLRLHAAAASYFEDLARLASRDAVADQDGG